MSSKSNKLTGTNGEFDLTRLTPVEERQGFFFKREDQFCPFGDKLNGGKLRQIMTILEDCSARGVITAASMHSPQIPLVAGAARHYGLSCLAIAGGGKRLTTELNLAKQLGARIVRSDSGRHRALFAKAAKLNSRLAFRVLPYGIVSASDYEKFFTIQSEQVRNIPTILDRIVVTCGSGISTISILVGLARFSKVVGELVVVGTAPSRKESILRILSEVSPTASRFCAGIRMTYIDLFNSAKFRYEREEPFTLCDIELHPRYEAKAFRLAVERMKKQSGRTLFWIVGRSLY